MQDILAAIALKHTPKIGDITAKKLVAYCGGLSQVYEMKASAFADIPNMPKSVINSLTEKKYHSIAEKELKFIEKNKIQVTTFWDKNYPYRLRECEDGPILLFYKGNIDFNAKRILSVVGTRNITSYGKDFIEHFIEDLINSNVLVISGMAYGVDIATHRACVHHGISTVGVMAHGLHMIYPSTHQATSIEMEETGGIVTELSTEDGMKREYFPKRNRIIAGLCDALVVVETAARGGSLITAAQANAYNREVFAVPGNIHDSYSKGCNFLIKSNRAMLLENAHDLLQEMNWSKTFTDKNSTQLVLFSDLSQAEQCLIAAFDTKAPLHIDQVIARTKMSHNELVILLLEMELKGLIQSMPGNMMRLIK